MTANMRVEGVSGAVGPVDRLSWTTRVNGSLLGTGHEHILLLEWDGQLVLSATAEDRSNTLMLAARWVRRDESARVRATGDVELRFEVELPGNAFARIEAFRDGGRLFARFDGKFMTLPHDGLHSTRAGATPRPLFLDNLVNPAHSPWVDPRCTAWEVPRDEWAEVVATLAPPGHLVIEIDLPDIDDAPEGAPGVLTFLDDAQRAFEQGRWSDVARVVYVALEKLGAFQYQVLARYGEELSTHLSHQLKQSRGLSNPERHGQATNRVDRVLAQHLLGVARSLAAVYLRSPPDL